MLIVLMGMIVIIFCFLQFKPTVLSLFHCGCFCHLKVRFKVIVDERTVEKPNTNRNISFLDTGLNLGRQTQKFI